MTGDDLDPRTLCATPPGGSGVVACVVYRDGNKVADVEVAAIREWLAHPEHMVWLGLYEPSEELLAEVQAAFGLHELAVEDAHNAHQRPKLEQYGDSLFTVLRTAQHVPTSSDGDGATRRRRFELEFGETHLFIGRNYVVTVRHGSLKSHLGLRARCESRPGQLAKGPGYVLYALMDFVVDQFLPIAETLEEELTDLEDEIFDGERSPLDREMTGRIYALKRDLLVLKRAVAPLVDVCNRLVRFESDLVPEGTRVYFRDVYDHVIRLNETIDAQRELLTTALEANLSLVSVAQSEETKRLAAWAAIIAVPTMLAGIYGMNFQFMPELQWAWGYPVVLGTMGLTCVLLWRGFRRSGWL